MRSAIRVVVSSYVVVTACTPSAAPAPGPQVVAEQEIQFGTARSGDGDTLSVRMSGPATVRHPSTVSFRATVVNSTVAHHYYWWFVASCATRGGCAPSSYTAIGDGPDMAAITIPFGADASEKDIVVQVAEIDGDGRTGSSVEFPVMGPAQPQGDGDGFTGTICDWYAGSFYPHVGVYTDPFTGRSWKRKFRRDYCGNRVSWDPGQ